MKDSVRRKSNGRLFLQIGLIAAGITLLVFGIYREEVAVVLNKATKICLECVGIG